VATLAELLRDPQFRRDIGNNAGDFLKSANNAVASGVTAPVDGLAWLLRQAGAKVGDAPIGGSDWANNVGLTGTPTNKNSLASLLGEAAGNIAPFAIAAKAPQIAGGLLRAGDNLAAPVMANKQKGAVLSSLSKTGDPVEAGRYFKYKGLDSFADVGKMTKEEFDTFYKNLPYQQQGKFDRLLRASSPVYDDLPTTMGQYAKDFGYENPGLVNRFSKVKPDDQVSIYRSVTNADPDKTIMPGDWIALEKKYAAQHGKSGNDKARMITNKVPAKDVRWAGTSADEYFYTPSGGINQEASSTHDALLRLLSRNGQNLP
jgi:hypothetical protein